MAGTARNLLAALNPEQRLRCVFPLEDEERFFWHYLPTDDIPEVYKRHRRGITLKELSAHQKHLASALLSAGLSRQGYVKAVTIMSLEEVLRILEKDVKGRRDPEKYHFSFFGSPSEDGTWAYRIEGHHISLHFTVVRGQAVGNPTMLGSNPAEVRSGPLTGLRVLGAEEERGRSLLHSLDPAQRRIAIVGADAYPDILTGNSRTAALRGQPSGLPAERMTPAQRDLLRALMGEYADNLAGELAGQRRARIGEADLNLHFAWAGTGERGGPHYYRVQAPGFLIEYDNTQNEANHAHSVWRDFEGDFGLDLLGQHYASASAGHGHLPGTGTQQGPREGAGGQTAHGCLTPSRAARPPATTLSTCAGSAWRLLSASARRSRESGRCGTTPRTLRS